MDLDALVLRRAKRPVHLHLLCGLRLRIGLLPLLCVVVGCRLLLLALLDYVCNFLDGVLSRTLRLHLLEQLVGRVVVSGLLVALIVALVTQLHREWVDLDVGERSRKRVLSSEFDGATWLLFLYRFDLSLSPILEQIVMLG